MKISKDFSDTPNSSVRYWFDPKNETKIKEYCKNKDIEEKKLISQGYIIVYNGVPYKEIDILEGKCPANGRLFHTGYRHLDNGKWRKI